ncbi:MAG: DNA mismatch repair protein MutS [Bacteroidales bacterium]|jgi:DNA mismatch repair protein MutS
MAKSKKPVAETPLMKQYNAVKAKYPDAILLFRVGDFYETFCEDAIIASNVLGITLTKRANGAASSVDLAGFPHHALDVYLPKLVKAGYKTAICDQLEDPKQTKTIVKRGVTELVTPGASYNENTFDQKNNNFLACIHFDKKVSGIALLDLSTGEFYVTEGDDKYIEKILQSFKPNEVIIQRKNRDYFKENFNSSEKFYVSIYDDWVFTEDFGYEKLIKHFNTNSLKGFGIDNMISAIIAGGGILHHLTETCHDKIAHINTIKRINEDNNVWLDKFTIRNLELINGLHNNSICLMDVIDNTVSPQGSRTLRLWVVMPLTDINKINIRQDITEYLIKNNVLRDFLREKLKDIGDIERIVSKIATGRVNPREIVHLKNSLIYLKELKEEFVKTNFKHLIDIAHVIDTCEEAVDLITKTIKEEPASTIQKCGVIKDGFSDELDEYRKLTKSSKEYLKAIQKRETERTGISSLKIGFNNVFGYYLEVTNTHKNKVPEDWNRKQTLVNSERYITKELKDLESKILNAETQIASLEQETYENLISKLFKFIKPIQKTGKITGMLDCLQSFAVNAIKFNYTRPVVDNSLELKIVNGRHPVIEQNMPIGESYIPNNVFLDNKTQQIMIITGPNMSGKSALLRQTALIVLLAQMGSYIPAESANIGIIDKIFTRVGASDNIASGESTFMVEMNEAANILNNMSDRSLILLDEIGRGTSTYDGVSIAWAIAEYIHDHPVYRPKVMFATHYHELNDLASTKKRIKNFHVTVKETENNVIFLRKLAKGGTEHSFGIHVAKMAGMPPAVIRKAEYILKQLEDFQRKQLAENDGKKISTSEPIQLSLIQMEDPLLIQIRDDILNTDINNLTPLEALNKLNEIKKLIEKL